MSKAERHSAATLALKRVRRTAGGVALVRWAVANTVAARAAPAQLAARRLPVNMNVLVGEDKHRAFKKWIYTTNHRHPEKDLRIKENQDSAAPASAIPQKRKRGAGAEDAGSAGPAKKRAVGGRERERESVSQKHGTLLLAATHCALQKEAESRGMASHFPQCRKNEITVITTCV